MSENKKCAFLSYKKESAKKLNQLLSKRLGFETELGDYLGRTTIDVPTEHYLESLIEGQKIARELGLGTINWVNSYNEPRPINCISVMFCKLPQTREGNSLWDDERYCPIDIKKYADKLCEFLNRHVIIRYNHGDNAIEFLVCATFEEYDLIRTKCEEFDGMNQNKPFIRTMFLEKDGTLIEPEVKKEEESTLKSYLNESLFVDGLLRPLGSNIVPKDENDNNLTTGYKYTHQGWGTRYFNCREEIDFFGGTKVKNFVGSFLVYEKKDYNHYWDNESKKQTNCDNMPFVMLDNGNFQSTVQIKTDDEIEVTTKVDVIRNIVGYNFDGKSLRDGLFKDFPYEDFRGSLEIKEYYKVIADGTKLLHYSDYSNFFEVYHLPDDWKIEDGISTLDYPKVFDDTSYDKQDKDLEEIINIINSKQTNQAKQLIKKNDSTN